MARQNPDFTLGIEEEYLLVDRDSLQLSDAPEALMSDCAAALEDQVSPEFLKCQIEIGTRVCATVAEGRKELKRLRATVAEKAANYGLAPIAASCHPLAKWEDQHHTDKARYNELEQALAGVVHRLLICGMHIHVGIADQDMRVDLMNQMTYFLPHLLALSGSSPFWQGRDTGLASYRLTVFDNLPRTGLPPRLTSWSEYERTIDVLIGLGVIEDGTKIWWDLRPSAKFPTLETRICDVPGRLEDTLTIAALNQCIARMLWRLARKNQRWRIYDSFLVGENRWRAQRYGMTDGLIDFGQREMVPFADLVEELIDMLGEDAEALGCRAELEAARGIASGGNSADRQRAIYKAKLQDGADTQDAMRAVIANLIDEFQEGL